MTQAWGLKQSAQWTVFAKTTFNTKTTYISVSLNTLFYLCTGLPARRMCNSSHLVHKEIESISVT